MSFQDLVYASKVYIEAAAPFLFVFTAVAVADDLIWLIRKSLSFRINKNSY